MQVSYCYFSKSYASFVIIKVSKKQIFEEKLSKYTAQKKITFPEIKEGTVLELEYKLVSPYTTVIDDLEFQKDNKCLIGSWKSLHKLKLIMQRQMPGSVERYI